MERRLLNLPPRMPGRYTPSMEPVWREVMRDLAAAGSPFSSQDVEDEVVRRLERLRTTRPLALFG